MKPCVGKKMKLPEENQGKILIGVNTDTVIYFFFYIKLFNLDFIICLYLLLMWKYFSYFLAIARLGNKFCW